jgi:quercetin dioxygenase-like cupin family protein
MENRFFNVKDYTSPAPEKATKHLLYQNDRSNGVIWVIPPGEELPAHYHPETDDVWIILEGKGDYYLGKGQTFPIEAGMFIPAEKLEIHGVKNTGNELLVFAAVSAPMPVEMIKE